jgi:hypothetical protein
MYVTEILPSILSQAPPASQVELHILNMVPSTEQRVVDLPELKPIIAEALELRATYRVPFWEAVLLLSGRRYDSASQKVLDAAGHHQPMTLATHSFMMTIAEVTTEKLAETYSALQEKEALVLSSKVHLSESRGAAHIPMLDFRVRPSPENERLTIDILNRLSYDGTLLNSGNSYHFYGRDLFSSYTKLVRFLGEASLFAPFVDQRWIAHQLIEGACALRISPGKNFGSPPVVVCEITSR